MHNGPIRTEWTSFVKRLIWSLTDVVHRMWRFLWAIMQGVRGVMSGYREAIMCVECYMTWESAGTSQSLGELLNMFSWNPTNKSSSEEFASSLFYNRVFPSIFFSKWSNFCLIRWIRPIGQNHPCMNRIQLQPRRSTENILVQWLKWLTVKQGIWVQSLVKSLNFCKFCFVELI